MEKGRKEGVHHHHDHDKTCMHACMRRSIDQLELHECLYTSNISRVHVASDKRTGQRLALKTYNKRKLSALDRYRHDQTIPMHAWYMHGPVTT